MKILFLYRYGILGGVCTQLYHRLLNFDKSIEVHCGFRNDFGITKMFDGLAKLHFDLTPIKIANLLKKENFDIIIIIDTEEYLDAVKQSSHNAIVILEVHTSIERNLQYLSNVEGSDVDAVVVVSEYMRDRVQQLTYHKLVGLPIIIFPNVVDSRIFSPKEIDVSGPPIIGWVGKLDDHKNWKDYLQICSNINSVNDQIEFWMIGGETSTEATRNSFLKQAEKLDLLNNLKWFDRIENNEMSKIYSIISRRGGLCLVTSKGESFGMSIVESLLCNCPVLATNVGAITEINNKTNGMMIYELGDISNAGNLCLDMIAKSKQLIEQLVLDRELLLDAYSSQRNSKDYLLMMEEITKNGSVDYFSLISKLSNSSLRFDKIFDYDSILRPLEYEPPKLRLTESLRLKPKVCTIMDEFSFNSFKDYFDLVNVSLVDWQNQFSVHKPDFFLLESAWKGHQFQWEHKINRRDDQLLKLLTYCRENEIPTVFWNKEDPVHFNTFLSTAVQCDYVFTTDVDCISNYKSILGHERVYMLPFAANPRIHNPISKFDRKSGASFAGAYYSKYSKRNENFASIVNALESEVDLDIFDRFFNSKDQRYSFPDEYKKYIKGNLPYEEIEKAYKGYEYGINLNTIKQSQSMFARRVYELMASNTAVISNFSRGLRVNFGDLVISSDYGPRIQTSLSKFKKDLRKNKYNALRKVLSESTYRHRCKYILSKICKNYEFNEVGKKVLFIGLINEKSDLDRIIQNVNRQKNIHCSTVFVTNDKELQKRNNVLSEEELLRNIEQIAAKFDYFIMINSLDYLGANCVYDMTLVDEFFDFDIVTKLNYYQQQNGIIKLNNKHGSNDYEIVSSVNLGCSLFSNNTKNLHFFKSHYNKGEQIIHCENLKIISIPEFDYVNCDSVRHDIVFIENNVNSSKPGVNLGLPLKQILLESEEITSNDSVGSSENRLTHEWFFDNISLGKTETIEFETLGNSLMVTSDLAPTDHKYLYSRIYFEKGKLFKDNNHLFFEITPGLDVMIVVFYYNNTKERLGSEVLTANTNHELNFPKKCEYIQFAIRLRGGGACEIKELLLEKKNISPQKIFTVNKNLILTDNYPSYENLYRNQFIHSRVQGYNLNQIGFDIFVLKSNVGIEYREFEGVDVIQASSDALVNLLKGGRYENIFIHFLNSEMWEIISKLPRDVNIFIWAHGAEIQPYQRRKFNYINSDEHKKAKRISKKRMEFWRNVFSNFQSNMRMVFVSKYFSEEVFTDVGIKLTGDQYHVIHNPIDTKRFSYNTKDVSQRMKILSIRTFASRKYANDISVNVILELSKHNEFSNMEILICGEGELFEEVTQPLLQFSNVELRRGFLSNEEYESIFDDYGIFLTPTRWDSHGVSRDEAMSAGLVPVTNSVSAIPEFVDENCAILGPDEDYELLAKGIIKLVEDKELFGIMSKNAAERVRQQSASEITIDKEIKLIEDVN